jgi:hypothetical protein
MESHMSDTALRLRVRQLLATGWLPVITPVQVAAGYGHGRMCVACDRPVTNDEMEYAIDDLHDGSRLNFHASCYSLWQSECAQNRHA